MGCKHKKNILLERERQREREMEEKRGKQFFFSFILYYLIV